MAILRRRDQPVMAQEQRIKNPIGRTHTKPLGRKKGSKNTKRKEPRPNGRPDLYNQTVADKICELLASGYSLTKITRMEGMPSYPTVMNWLWRETPYKARFVENYQRAREFQAEFQADEIIDISDDGSNDYIEKTLKDGSVVEVFNSEHVARSKLRVDTRKWVASKMRPKKYGDRIQTEVSAPDGAPLIPVATTIILDFGESK